MSEKWLEEIKARWDNEILDSALWRDLRRLVSEVERQNRMLTSAYIFKAQEDHNRMMAEKDATIATLREALGNKEVEWSSGPYRNKCPWCDGLYPTHRQDCKRQEVLK